MEKGPTPPPLSDKTLDTERARFKETGTVPAWKVVCYNVNGFRSLAKANNADSAGALATYLSGDVPDILCLGEVKCDEVEAFQHYDLKAEFPHIFWNESKPDLGAKRGYAGTAVCCKHKPLEVVFGLNGEADPEGRCITLEFETVFVVATYVPNSGEELKFEQKRRKWNIDFRSHLHRLELTKPVIVTGDLNVAYLPFDVYDGEINRNRPKGAGFTTYEREAMDTLIREDGFVDLFRHFHPSEKEGHFTFWSNRGKDMKGRNKGWRLDYFLVSPELVSSAKSVVVQRGQAGSDHVPLELQLK